MAFSTSQSVDQSRPGVLDVTIALADTAGASGAFQLDGADTITLSAEFTGTTPGTVTLQCSNDGTNFYALPTTLTVTADGTVKAVGADGKGFLHYRLSWAGGSADGVWAFRVVGIRNSLAKP